MKVINTFANITALKREPMGTIHNRTAENREYLQELAENAELVQQVQERKENRKIIAVNIDDL